MVDVDDRYAGLFHAFAHRIFAVVLAAFFEWRTVDDQHAFGAGRAAGAHRCRAPDVFTNIQADAYAVEFEHGGVFTRGKVALLVEYSVVGEELLAVVREHLAVLQDRAGVIDMAVCVFGKPNQDRDARNFIANLTEAGIDGMAQAAVEQQVFGRVPADGEFRKDDDIGAAGVARLAGEFDDPRGVGDNVAYHEVDLRKCNPDGVAHCLITARAPGLRC